jgi:hypothetical protein
MQMLSDDLEGIATLLATELYLTPALPPPMVSAAGSVTAPPFLGATGTTVSITHPSPQSLRAWTVYRDAGATYVLDRIVPASETSLTLATGRWAIAAVARTDVESGGRVIEIP